MKEPKKNSARIKPKILPENELEKTLVSKAEVAVRNCLEMADRAVLEDRLYIARQLLDKALLNAPANAGVVMAYGRFQLFRGDFETALATFQRALKLEPKLFTANFFIGKTLLHLSMIDDARYAFREALARNAQHAPSLLELARIQEMTGHRKRAIQLLKKALALKPGAMIVSRRLAELVDKVEGQDGLYELIRDRNCNLAYRTLHVMARHLVRSGYFLEKRGYKKSVNNLLRYLEAAGISDQKKIGEIIEHSFLSNLHYPASHWRERALSHCEKAVFNRWVKVEGLERYRKAAARGKGVILVRGHLVPGWVALLAFDRLGIETTSVAYRDALGNMNIRFRNRQTVHTLEGNTNIHWEHLQVMRALKQGGTMIVSGDTHLGKDEIVLPFLGRSRVFKPGFAFMSLATGAPVLPLFSSMDPAGHITIQILPELKQRPGLARKKRIRDLVSKYARRLEAHWKAHPGNLPWEAVNRFMCSDEPA